VGKFALLFVLLLVSGCFADAPEPAPQPSVDLAAIVAENHKLLAEHKITNVEAATRYNGAVEQATNGELSDRDRALMAYRLTLAAEVDSRKITIAMANQLLQKRIADYRREDLAAQNTAAKEASSGTAPPAQVDAQPTGSLGCGAASIDYSTLTACY